MISRDCQNNIIDQDKDKNHAGKSENSRYKIVDNPAGQEWVISMERGVLKAVEK